MGDLQAHGLSYQGRDALENVQLLKESEKKNTSRGFFISTLPHVKLIAEIHVYARHKNMQSMGIFLQFLESFPGKIYKKYSIGNEVWLESQTGTITSDYVLHNHLSIS